MDVECTIHLLESTFLKEFTDETKKNMYKNEMSVLTRILKKIRKDNPLRVTYKRDKIGRESHSIST